jgi:hypothetical protein
MNTKQLSSPFELIKKAVNLFAKKENLAFLIQIYLPEVVFMVLVVAISLLFTFIKNLSPIVTTSLIVFFLIICLFLWVFVSASGIVAVKKIVKGDSLSVRGTFKEALKVYWKFFAVALLTSLILAGGPIVISVVGNLIDWLLTVGLGVTSGFLNNALGTIGALFAIATIIASVVFVFIFSVQLAFSRFIFIDQNLGVWASLLKSRKLVKGTYWAVLVRLIVFGVISWVIRLILSQLPYGVGFVILFLCGGLLILPSYLLYKELSE